MSWNFKPDPDQGLVFGQALEQHVAPKPRVHHNWCSRCKRWSTMDALCGCHCGTCGAPPECCRCAVMLPRPRQRA